MKIDFATLAFGYTVKAGGGTPNWATALGQGKEYKINESRIQIGPPKKWVVLKV